MEHWEVITLATQSNATESTGRSVENIAHTHMANLTTFQFCIRYNLSHVKIGDGNGPAQLSSHA
jgi:hypothetical protein